MEQLDVLWVDLCLGQGQGELRHYAERRWHLRRVTGCGRIKREIEDARPRFLCFEYDYPDSSRLLALQRVRGRFSSIPIIMLTEQHSEALAVWAFRSRVWDYLVKPVRPEEFYTSAESLLQLPDSRNSRSDGQAQTPLCPIPSSFRFRCRKGRTTLSAELFVESHYQDKIREEEVASLCGMSVSCFSRTFKKEHKVTFREYLLGYRIRKSREFLRNPNVTVTDVAYMAGFNDPSYFSRMFRRFTRQTPSSYQESKLYELALDDA